MCKASEHIPEWIKRPKTTEKETQEQPPKKEKKKVVPTGKDSVMSD